MNETTIQSAMTKAEASLKAATENADSMNYQTAQVNALVGIGWAFYALVKTQLRRP